MWKNKGRAVKLEGVYSTFLVEGVDFERLLNKLRKEEIEVRKVKRKQNKRLQLSIKTGEEKKFFAITDYLCYNVKKIGVGGKRFWLYKLIVNPFLAVGIIIFSLLGFLFDDFVLGINYTGNGNIYSSQAQTILEQKSIGRFTRFSSIDLGELADGILGNSQKFSFVSCKKQGKHLNIELILKENEVYIKENIGGDFLSSIDGRVEKIYLYRGTALVKEGDQVKKGDLLVGGYAIIKDKEVKVSPLAVITLSYQKEYLYLLEKEDDESAKTFADLERENGKILKLEKKKIKDKYYYKVIVEYRENLYTG